MTKLLSAFKLIKDSRGAPSWAHSLAVPFTVLTMFKWLLGGLTFVMKTFTITIPPTTASDAAMILGVWLAFLGQREWTEKKMESQKNGNTSTQPG